MARAWQRNGFITEDEYYFLLKKNTFPLSMIDKITPHPDNRIADKLAADGLENAKPFVTEKGTHAAVCGTSPDCRKRYKIAFDHRQKNLYFYRSPWDHGRKVNIRV